jgi:recombination protein U|tara:strand:+ start:416 stop:940 length:525 start_codon:yes stop_codon:yes gene_type:complete
MKRNDTGKQFESEVRRSLKNTNCFWFRIQDTNDVARFLPAQAVAEKQPGDFMSVYQGMAVLIECKTSKRQTSFPLYYKDTRSIPEHQVEAAKRIEQNGGRAFFLIRQDQHRDKKVYAMTWRQITNLYKSKRKSVKWEHIKSRAIPVRRLKSPLRWDLEGLYKKVLNRKRGFQKR